MANYPTSISTNANLYIAVNGLQTTLATAINASVTTITLTSTSGFPSTGLVTINNLEVVSYTGISGSDLTGCTRGADGTSAVSHNAGVTVGLTVVAAHHNLLKDEIIAIETALGTNLSNIFPIDLTTDVTGILPVANGGTGVTSSTGSGSVVLNTSPTLVTPNLGTPSAAVLTNATGLPLTTGVTGVLPNANTTATPNATASTIMSRDASVNSRVNEMIENFSTTATAAGTTTLSVTSSPLQQFTGTTTQTVKLPDATTLVVGHYFTVLNRSTGVVTVTDNSNATVQALNAGAQTTFVLTNNGTAAGVWDASTSSGSGSVAQYATYIVGTASGTYTGSTTVVNLPFAYVQDGKTLNFYYNGQQLTPAVDYTETSSTSITLTSAMVVGARIMARSNASSSTATAVTFYREDYIVGTASGSYTGSLTVFNLTNTYTPGGTNLKMYVDGDLMTVGASADYLETSSSIVTSNNALVAGQRVAFIFSQSVAPAGTVSSGTVNQIAYYSATGSTIAGSSAVTVGSSGSNGIIQGTNTNDNAATGKVGEYVESTSGSQNAAATATYDDATSISLTAGDWDISSTMSAEPNGATWTEFESAISTNSGNNGAGLSIANDNRGSWASSSSTPSTHVVNVVNYRVSISATTTFYLKRRFVYSAGTPRTTAGIIRARRVR